MLVHQRVITSQPTTVLWPSRFTKTNQGAQVGQQQLFRRLAGHPKRNVGMLGWNPQPYKVVPHS